MATTSRRSGAVSTKAKRQAAVSRPPERLHARKAKKAAGGTALPGWQNLPGTAGAAPRITTDGKAAQRRAAARNRLRALDTAPSLRFGVITLVVCVLATLFVAHVYATGATLDSLQEARRANERLRLTHQRLKGDFDRMTGPSAVMPRALALGLEEGVAYGPPIHLGSHIDS